MLGELFAYTSAKYPFNVLEKQNVTLHINVKDDYDGFDQEVSAESDC